ncbi:DUF1128 family protein [Staphylococcus carnosus]|uniref:UPF0435 protein Sca_1453 n=2 Tax=Staphylococcus carnosus TaxID=1281 RepID=Y1453_STACT|nr:DUF1128 family protein [Staphylococcus carnosus]B9DMV6.1 RecName: Full=UPF0435 protein Sca_1453 [Staphylococcus carnosus subsp. carnosus TM300]ANZ32987.1 hypothetical protein BEK99_03660 [Staphylococcus carnosus]KKB24718.1 hypothetical protein VV61_10535 [Staphylococcus carnosus]KOR12338.1 hypothetical protein AMC75_10420 [Staphylococcus carnosus]POA02741.1 DUF1128 domain-containing protein [Staphylococcus carnosus]QPT04466.1 DUF1128 domain-containing protein [Staphylococcus carnosus]
MASNNKEMIEEIRKQLNVVNVQLIDPDKFEDADEEKVKEIHSFVTSKDNFSPSEVTAIASELGELRQS